MANSRKLIVEVVGDTSKLDRSLKKSQKELALFGRSAKLEQATRGGLSSFGGKTGFLFGSGAFVGSAAAAAVLKSSITAASDLNEQISRSTVVFGKNAAEVQDWANTLATSFGIANTQGLAAASTFGAMFEQAGRSRADAATLSRQIVQLAGDLASFSNTSVDEALNALRSGLSGEIEPLRRFQVFLTEAAVAQQALADTGKASTKQLTQGEKIIARYELIMKQTALAQGDFARTQGELANQTRKLQAQIKNLVGNLGETLVPAVTGVVTVLNDAIIATNGLADAFGRLSKVKIAFPGLPKSIAPTVGSLFGAAGRGIGNSAFVAPVRGLIQALSPKPGVIAATGQRPGVFGSLLDGLTRPGGRAARPFGRAETLPAIKDLSDALRNKELDARIAGDTKRLRGVLVKQGAFLRDALINSFGLTAKDRLAMKQTLLAITDEIKGIDQAADDAAQSRAQAAKLAADRARQAAADLRARRKELAAAAVAARTARQFRALGLTATGEAPVPGVANLRKQVATLRDRLAQSTLNTPKRQSLLRSIAGVLAGDRGEVTRDVRARIAEMFDGIRQELKDQMGKTAQQTKTTTLGFSVLQGLGLSRDEQRQLRARLSGFNSAGVALASSSGTAAFGATVAARPVVVESRVTLNLDGKPLTTFVTRGQQRAKQRNPSQRRGR